MARNLLPARPISVAQLAPDVLSRFRNKGQNGLVAFLPLVLRVVALAGSHLPAIQRVHGGIGVQGDGGQPHVRRFPHSLPHLSLDGQQLPRYPEVQ
jgi:hypothetical protein